jgi:hypothetical protein
MNKVWNMLQKIKLNHGLPGCFGFFEVFGIVSSVFLCTSVRTEASQLCQLDLDAVDGFEDVFVGVFEDVVGCDEYDTDE